MDGKAMKTPSKRPFAMPTKAMALVVALEWDAQIRVIETSTMPVTMLAATALDVTPLRRDATVTELLRYLVTDLVCFPLAEDDAVDEEDLSLAEKQAQLWQQPIAHFTGTYGPISIASARDLTPPKHSEKAMSMARKRLEGMSDWELTSALSLAQGCKSLIVPLGVLDGAVPVDKALAAARAEEDHQIQHWGLVEGGHDVDLANVKTQVLAALLLTRLSKP